MPTYYRVAENETPFDAVTIAIGQSDSKGVEAGLFWPAREFGGQYFEAGIEVLGDVESAFSRAHEVARERGFERIAVMLQHDGLWDDDWGTLVETTGHEPVLDLLWASDADIMQAEGGRARF